MSRGPALRLGAGLVAGALAALLLGPLAVAWASAPDLGHGWAAPLLIGYLLWERWPQRPAFVPRHRLGSGWWLLAVGLGLAALPVRLLLIPYPLWPALVCFHVALLAAAALIAAWLAAGWPGVRWLGGPLVILAAAVPWPYQIQEHLIGPLREGIAGLAAEICNLLGRPALAAGTTVRLGNAWIGIDQACGGIRSLQAVVMLALFLGEWNRFPWRRRIGLAAVGVLAALAGNFLRILFLAFRLGAGLPALLAAHDPAGWAALLGSVGATGLAAWWWSRSSVRPPLARPEISRRAGTTPSVLAWLGVVAAIVAIDETAARWWFARGTAELGRRQQWTVRLPDDLWSYRSDPLSEEARDILSPDNYVAGHWEDGDHRRLAAYYVEWRRGQTARFIPFLHNPTVCLPYAGCDLEQSLGVIGVPWRGGTIPFHAYIFRQAGEDLAVAFVIWDPTEDRPLVNAGETAGWRQWFRRRWADVAHARRDQPAQLLSLAISGRDARDRLPAALGALIVSP